jgi:hypothetical protein
VDFVSQRFSGRLFAIAASRQWHIVAHWLQTARAALASQVNRNHHDVPTLARSASLLRTLLIVQLGLGLGAYLAKFTAVGAPLNPYLVPRPSHVVIGALMLVTSIRLTCALFVFSTASTQPSLYFRT